MVLEQFSGFLMGVGKVIKDGFGLSFGLLATSTINIHSSFLFIQQSSIHGYALFAPDPARQDFRNPH